MDDLEIKKQAIIKALPGAVRWIDSKSEKQVIAIYFRCQREGKLK